MSNKYIQRENGAFIPSTAELFVISAKESQRLSVNYDFVRKNSDIFGVHRDISALASSDDSWIDTYPSLSLEDLVLAIDKNHRDIAGYIKRSESNEQIQRAIYNALIPYTATDSTTDAIFVFGAASNARIERAVELYKCGTATKILLLVAKALVTKILSRLKHGGWPTMASKMVYI